MAHCSKEAFSACAVLINPSRSPRRARSLARLLGNAGASRVVVCGTKENLRAGVQAFVESSERYLLVFGGDGTVHEALNTLVVSSGGPGLLRGKAVGFLRGGSGNGYHDSYRVPIPLGKQLEACARSMASNRTVDVDLIRVDFEGGSLYGQLAGVGFDAEVLVRREARASYGEGKGGKSSGGRPTRPKGLVGYFAAALEAFRRLDLSPAAPSNALRIVLYPGTAAREKDGSTPFREQRPDAPPPLSLTVPSAMVEVGKRPYYGNRFRVCPGAICNDGLLEVVLFNFDTKLSALVHLAPLWAGWHRGLRGIRGKAGRPLIERYKAVRFEVSSDRPLVFHVDGELPPASGKARSLSLTVLPEAISFIVPRRFLHRPPLRALPGRPEGVSHG